MSQRKIKTAKYGKVESIHIGMVPAKLHLPVMGISMLSSNMQQLHGRCMPSSDSV
jgi:hypothetical protein